MTLGLAVAAASVTAIAWDFASAGLMYLVMDKVKARKQPPKKDPTPRPEDIPQMFKIVRNN